MRRWFLSYHSRDLAVAERLVAALERVDAEADVFFAPRKLRAGGYWLPILAEEIGRASVFVLLVGEEGLGQWQILEYYEALDKRTKSSNFPVVVVLLEGQPAPGLPFLRQLHWIITADPTSEESLGRLIDASAGAGTRPGELWRYTSPYRGLAAMTEADSDFFFGRESETVEVLNAIAAEPDRLPVLLGNSGVGKSSLAQAGVLGALKRQAWPERAAATGGWPDVFHNSRRWCFLKLNPGTTPLKALVEPFLDTWQLGTSDPERVKQQNGWIELLRDGKAALTDLLDATERRHAELHHAKPPAFLLYIDQGEELYVRAEARQRSRFSELLAETVSDPRLVTLMSMRSDYLGHLQNDEQLYRVHRQINVPPLRQSELSTVIGEPARQLSARFESDELIALIARRTSEDSVRDVGALPLLSYTLDDMWTEMVRRGDGWLRLPAAAFELGGVLADRANAFLARNPASEDALRRLLTIRLATVRKEGDPTRRRALMSEFSDNEWRLVSDLADHPYRLLVTATPEGGVTYAEVAHEAIFRRWDKLRNWINSERDFLAWKAALDDDHERWKEASEPRKNDALLMGLGLAQAQGWIVQRAEDLSKSELEFIDLSRKVDAERREANRQLEIQRARAEEEVARLRAEREAQGLRERAAGEEVARLRAEKDAQEQKERAAAEEVARLRAEREARAQHDRAAAEESAKLEAEREVRILRERSTRRVKTAAMMTLLFVLLAIPTSVIVQIYAAKRAYVERLMTFAQHDSSPNFHRRILLLLHALDESNGVFLDPRFPREVLRTTLARSPNFGGTYTAVGFNVSGTKLAILDGEKLTVHDLSTRISAPPLQVSWPPQEGSLTNVGGYASSIFGEPYVAGFIDHPERGEIPALYREGILLYWDEREPQSIDLRPLLPKETGANLRAEIAGAVRVQRYFLSSSRGMWFIELGLVREANGSLGVRNSVPESSVPAAGPRYLPTISAKCRLYGYLDTQNVPSNLFVGTLGQPEHPSKLSLDESSVDDTPDSSFVRAISFSADCATVTVRQNIDSLTMVPIETVDGAVRLSNVTRRIKVPAPAQDVVHPLFVQDRPLLASSRTAQGSRFSWLTRNGITVVDVKDNASEGQLLFDLPILVGLDNAVKLQFSEDGAFLTLLQRSWGATRAKVRVWDFSRRRLDEIPHWGDGLVAEACRIAKQENGSETLESSDRQLWLKDENAPSPCSKVSPR